jgi:phage baseplate assembly protein gpV
VVKTVGQAVGLTPGTVESTAAVHEFFQQSMETDWEFCWRLATMNDFEFVVENKKFHFRKRKREGVAATLTWGDNLLTFKPRMSGIGQAKDVTVANHDPKARQALSGNAATPVMPGASQAVQSRAEIVGKLGGGSVVVADRVVTTDGEASKAAQATLDRLASTFVEADGKAHGDPKIKAGATIKTDKVGSFSGEYVLTQTTHVIGAGRRYTTAFVISGRSGHTFSDLLRNGGNKSSWSESLVIGTVTNNNDPDGMGRVRVKFPALGNTMEGWWARVATLNAGAERGVFMLPQPGDEVVCGFEHGDSRRPFVLGSLYTGKEKVPADLKDDKTRKALFGVKSDEKVHVEGQQAMLLRSHEKMTLEVLRDGQGGTGDFLLDSKGNVEQKAAQNFKQTAGQSIEIQANQSVTIKGSASVTVEATGSLKLKGATIDIEGTGPVNVKGAIINLG